MLQSFFGFLTAESRDVQKYDPWREGLGEYLKSEREQRRRRVPITLDDGSLLIEHCERKPTKLSEGEFQSFKEKFRFALTYAKENFGKLGRVGEILEGNVFKSAFNCPTCRTRFEVRVFFDTKKIPELLGKLQSEEV